MPDEVKPDAKQAPTQDAQLAAENMNTGQEATPTVDFEADYEAAQRMSVSDIDRSGKGAKAAEAATGSDMKVPKSEETKTESKSTSNPDDYMEMAQEVNPKE